MENNTLAIITTILIIENLLLLGLVLIWLNRHCKSCQKVKCLERVFNKTCSKCKNGKERENKRNHAEI